MEMGIWRNARAVDVDMVKVSGAVEAAKAKAVLLSTTIAEAAKAKVVLRSTGAAEAAKAKAGLLSTTDPRDPMLGALEYSRSVEKDADRTVEERTFAALLSRKLAAALAGGESTTQNGLASGMEEAVKSSNGKGSPSEELLRKRDMVAEETSRATRTYIQQTQRTMREFAEEIESAVDTYGLECSSASIEAEECRVYEVVVAMKQLFQFLEETLALNPRIDRTQKVSAGTRVGQIQKQSYASVATMTDSVVSLTPVMAATSKPAWAGFAAEDLISFDCRSTVQAMDLGLGGNSSGASIKLPVVDKGKLKAVSGGREEQIIGTSAPELQCKGAATIGQGAKEQQQPRVGVVAHVRGSHGYITQLRQPGGEWEQDFFFWVDGQAVKCGDEVSFHFDSAFVRKKVYHRRKALRVTTIHGGGQVGSA